MTDIPETVPDFWAVHTGTGIHIGLWPSQEVAREIAREYDDAVVTPLYAAPVAPSVEREAVPAFERELHDGIIGRLVRLTVGSCSCDTKSPELKYHSEDCRYRIASEALELARPLYTLAAPKQEAVDTDLVRRAEADVLAERERQRMKKGWTSDHDDEHRQGQMARAAAAYAYFGSLPDIDKLAEKDRTRGSQQGSFVHFIVSQLFPAWGTAYGGWGWEWWKPTNRRRDLVKAGALIIAEIERLDRLDALSSRGAE